MDVYYTPMDNCIMPGQKTWLKSNDSYHKMRPSSHNLLCQNLLSFLTSCEALEIFKGFGSHVCHYLEFSAFLILGNFLHDKMGSLTLKICV